MRLVLIGLLLVATAGCGQEATSPSTTSLSSVPAGVWTRLPDAPLSARQGVVAAVVGDELVLVGGYSGPPCPPNADCAYPVDSVERDGAAYNLQTGAWRRIAPAPKPVPETAPTTVIDNELYVLSAGKVLVYDPVADAWSQVSPPHPVRWADLAGAGRRLIVAAGSDEHGIVPDYVLDTETGDWSQLPPDPFKPAFDRVVTSTSEGLVLTAKPLAADGSPEDPALVHAAVLRAGETSWRVLPVSEQIGGWRWSWTGERLVDPTLGGADGGEVDNYGRVLAYGGRLDPATGVWSALPDAPEERTGGWSVEAPGGPLVAADGWIYDDRTGSWTSVPRPADAPADAGTAVWAGSVLIVHGGADWKSAQGPDEWTAENVYSTGTWAYRAR